MPDLEAYDAKNYRFWPRHFELYQNFNSSNNIAYRSSESGILRVREKCQHHDDLCPSASGAFKPRVESLRSSRRSPQCDVCISIRIPTPRRPLLRMSTIRRRMKVPTADGYVQVSGMQNVPYIQSVPKITAFDCL